MNLDKYPDVLTLRECQKILQVSRGTMLRLLHEGVHSERPPHDRLADPFPADHAAGSALWNGLPEAAFTMPGSPAWKNTMSPTERPRASVRPARSSSDRNLAMGDCHSFSRILIHASPCICAAPPLQVWMSPGPSPRTGSFPSGGACSP